MQQLDVAIPADKNVVQKEAEKTLKYKSYLDLYVVWCFVRRPCFRLQSYDPHTTYDMLPQHQVNDTKLITKCFFFNFDISKEQFAPWGSYDRDS